MKIGIVLRRLHTHGGTERRTRELIRGLLDAGHMLHLFAEEWDRDLAKDLTCHRIHTIKAARWVKALSFAMLAARATRSLGLDLVHSQGRTYADDVATLGGGCHADYLERFLADFAPMRRSWERNHPFNRVVLALEKAQYRRCSRLILNSHLAKSGLVRFFPWAEAKCRVVHNSVDSEFFHPDAELRAQQRKTLGIADDTVAYLFVGNGFERKGMPEFMQAFSLMRKRRPQASAVAVVVGNGDFPRYTAFAEQLDIKDRVIFAGETKDTRPFYAAGDAFVLPTKFDPFANTTNEALAAGLPVITTASNGGSEVVDPGVGYVIQRAGEIEPMANAMESLLDTDHRRTLALNARENAVRRPWRVTTEKTLAVYEEILSERTSH